MNIIDVNMENQAVVRMMKAMCRAKQKELSDVWAAERGVALVRKECVDADGEKRTVFVISPEGMEKTEGKILYLHGGAFALPVQQSALELAAVYAKERKAQVWIPEYRLLPEYSGEAIFRDCIDFWKQMVSDADGVPLLVYGESAGGTLAAGLVLYLRDRKETMPSGMCLIYPALDCSEKYTSKEIYQDAVWSRRSNTSMWNAFLKDAGQQWMKYLVPMTHQDVSGLPPFYIEPQERDILKDEAVAFGKRLSEAGVWCRINTISGTGHSFDSDLNDEKVKAAIRERVKAMGELSDQQ